MALKVNGCLVLEVRRESSKQKKIVKRRKVSDTHRRTTVHEKKGQRKNTCREREGKQGNTKGRIPSGQREEAKTGRAPTLEYAGLETNGGGG